jgi:hypothetical protein
MERDADTGAAASGERGFGELPRQPGMPSTCGNVFLGLVGQQLNHASATSLHREPAITGCHRTLAHPGDAVKLATDSSQSGGAGSENFF